MLRILLTISLGALVGWGLGHLQASISTSGFEERFSGPRGTLAEAGGEQLLDESVAQSASQGAPKLEIIGGNEFLFDTMQHGDSQSHTFVFRNIGQGPLNLEMGASTCKCTVGKLDTTVLLPGEETDVTLTWNGVSVTNDFAQAATIYTNAPDSPEVKIKVRGQVAGSFVIEPKELILGDIAVTDTIHRKFHVFTYLEQAQELRDFRWTDAKSADKVKLSVNKLEMDPEKYPDHPKAVGVHEVEVTIEPGLNLGLLSSHITFTTDLDEKVGTLEVPVSARVAGDLTLVGGPSFDSRLGVLKFGTVQSNQGAKASMSLVVQGVQRDEINPEIVSVIPDEALKVTLGEPKVAGNRKFYPIDFEVPKGAPETYYAGANPKDFGHVVIKTHHDITKEVVIHIQLNVVK